jgi:two-component system sensor kinase FixL
LEREKKTLEGILLSSVDPILVISPSGIILRVNESTSRMFGYSQSELLGQNVSMLMPGPYRSQHDDYLRRYLSTGLKKVIGVG